MKGHEDEWGKLLVFKAARRAIGREKDFTSHQRHVNRKASSALMSMLLLLLLLVGCCCGTIKIKMWINSIFVQTKNSHSSQLLR